jgi:Do/DeqQ family serine protease
MKQLLKSQSFLGGIVGGILVLLTVFIVGEVNNHNQRTTINNKEQYFKKQFTTPVQKANFTPQQAIDFTTAAEKSINAVVHIKTQTLSKPNSYDDFFGQFQEYLHQYPQRKNSYIAFGSGVIISSTGYIVTNNHVIDGADKISVTFNDERETEAVIVGIDPITDLALIKVSENDLPYLTFGNSDDIKIGEWVLAVGNPFNLNSTVTAGIVSAKARNINILGGQSIESFIQTDAVVNRGNSGGALVNTKGELIGINTAIASHTGVYEGYSFAIPANIVKKVVGDLLEYGEIQRGYLGVQIQDINADFAEATGLTSVDGIFIAGVVENSGAYDAGIKEGDIIISVNEIATNSISSLLGIVAQYNPGTAVKVKVKRSNKTLNYDVILKNKNSTTVAIKAGDIFYNNLLGAQLQQVSTNELNKLGIANGLKILDIDGGILKDNGINKGFIITEVNGIRVNSQQNLSMGIDKYQGNKIRIIGIYPNGVKVSYEFMY